MKSARNHESSLVNVGLSISELPNHSCNFEMNSAESDEFSGDSGENKEDECQYSQTAVFSQRIIIRNVHSIKERLQLCSSRFLLLYSTLSQ